MGLVNDHDVVLGQDRKPLERVDREQRVVGDHHVRLAGLGPGALGEALLHEGALAPQALLGGHGDLPPRGVRDTRLDVVPVPGLGGLDPFPQPQHLLGQATEGAIRAPCGGSRTGDVEQGAVVVRVAALDLVQARVVGAALEQRDDGAVVQFVLERVEQAGDVPARDLGLQGQRGRGHDHGLVRGAGVTQGWDKVCERLTRTGPCLDQQMPAGLEGLGDLGRHEPLSLPALPAQRGHGGVEELERVHRAGQRFGADVREVVPRFVDERCAHAPAGSPAAAGLPGSATR